MILDADIDWPANITSRGLGCCTFRSLDYAARLQNEPKLVGLPEQMKESGIAGGGYPEKLDKIIQRFDREAHYWNDTTKSVDILHRAWLSKRLSCVDYNGHDPHYKGGIAHCVCIAAADPESDWIAVLDNNFPSLDEIIWMSVEEFKSRWGGWSYGLFNEQVGRLGHEMSAPEKPRPSSPNSPPVFGLELMQPYGKGDTIIDGRPASVKDILDQIGGEMIPKIEPKIEPKISVDTQGLLFPAGIAVAGLFLFWVITDTARRN